MTKTSALLFTAIKANHIKANKKLWDSLPTHLSATADKQQGNFGLKQLFMRSSILTERYIIRIYIQSN